MKLPKYSTWELVVIVLLGVIFGVVNAQFSALWVTLMGIGGRVLANLIFGTFYISSALAAYIIRKPGAALLNGIVLGLVEMLAGTPFGIVALLWTTAQGLGIDVGYALFRHKRYDWIAVSVAALMVGPFHYTVNFFVNRYYTMPLWNIPVALMGYVEGVIVAGFGAMLIANLLEKTGVLSGLKISEDMDREEPTAVAPT